MRPFVVASVPYVNAIPLTDRLTRVPGIEVLFDVPSRLPALLESGQADAILVSSVDALRTPGRRMAAGVCIGTDGPVKSVRLFSKVPLAEIRTLALDASSMTSNRLAQIVLAERYGVHPQVTTMPPLQDEMLATCDACVLIGDIGMTAPSEGLVVADLGEEWRGLTGKPFVWAAWIGGEGLTPALARLLAQGADLPPLEEARLDRLVELATGHRGWTDAMIRDYYENVMVYRMGHEAIEGLREYQRRLLANGFGDAVHFPEIVEPEE